MGFSKSLVFGVGTNDAEYTVCPKEYLGFIGGARSYKNLEFCPFYVAWVSMLRRCYSSKTHHSHPTYIGCTVHEDWLKFSNFKVWMEDQDYDGKQLDKDLLGGGKIYSPDTCCFIKANVNNFLSSFSRPLRSNNMPRGIRHDNRIRYKKYTVTIRCLGKTEYLGAYETLDEAVNVWKLGKLRNAEKIVSAGYLPDHLINPFMNKVEELLNV